MEVPAEGLSLIIEMIENHSKENIEALVVLVMTSGQLEDLGITDEHLERLETPKPAAANAMAKAAGGNLKLKVKPRQCTEAHSIIF